MKIEGRKTLAGMSEDPGTALGELKHSKTPFNPASYGDLWDLFPHANCFFEQRAAAMYEPYIQRLKEFFGIEFDGRQTDVRYSADPDSPGMEKRPNHDYGPKGYFFFYTTTPADRELAQRALAAVMLLRKQQPPDNFGYDPKVYVAQFFKKMRKPVVTAEYIRISDWHFCVCAWRKDYRQTEPGGSSRYETPTQNRGTYVRPIIKRELAVRDANNDPEDFFAGSYPR